MFSKLAIMTVLVAFVGFQVVSARSVTNAAAPTCPNPNTDDPLNT